jgi:uncharacterized membrane protein YvbJ
MHAIISIAILAAALGVLSLIVLYFVRKAKSVATTVVTDTEQAVATDITDVKAAVATVVTGAEQEVTKVV